MTLSTRIAEARERTGLTQAEVGKYFGISRAAVAQWEQENGTAPDGRKLPDLANLLEVDLVWLLTGAGSPNGAMSPEEAEILDLYRRLGPEGKRVLVGTAELLLNQPSNDPTQVAPAARPLPKRRSSRSR